ncbi:MAG: hypothetical protein EAX87_07165 [Candidatus Thorarchaeota archaeon]|nr:hypothetical protein [Candidatus Thorarchaeota archaeon]
MKIDDGTTLTTEKYETNERQEHNITRTSLALIRTIDAEKRTHLAELRTGIGIITIALSLLTVIIAIAEIYSVIEALGFTVTLIAGIAFLFIIGGYLALTSLRNLRKDAFLRSKCEDLSCLVSEFGNHDHD